MPLPTGRMVATLAPCPSTLVPGAVAEAGAVPWAAADDVRERARMMFRIRMADQKGQTQSAAL